MSNMTFYFIILVLMYKYTSSYLMGMQSFTYSTFMEYQKIMLYTQDVWGKKTNAVSVPMYLLMGELNSKEIRRQIYKMTASFSECYESNGRLC